MRRWRLALALVVAACGGTKKSSSTPASETEEGESRDDDTRDRDQARPDYEDDMPSKDMDPSDE